MERSPGAELLHHSTVSSLTPLGTFRGREFYLNNSLLSTEGARAVAQRLGDSLSTRAFLATLDSREVQDWLHARFASTAWIGLSDEIEEGVWRWDSGEPYAFAFWSPGEPNVGAAENYTIVNWVDDGRWNNATGALLPSIIEVYRDCPTADGRLVVEDAPADQGGRIALDWRALAPSVVPDRFIIRRATDLCLLSSALPVPIDSVVERTFVDDDVTNYESYFYRVDAFAGDQCVDSLLAGPVVAFPNLEIARVNDIVGTLEIRNLAPTPTIVDGLRAVLLSPYGEYRGQQPLSGAIPERRTASFPLTDVGNLERGSKLFLLPSEAEFRLDWTIVAGQLRAVAQPNAFDTFQAGLPIRVEVLKSQFVEFRGGLLYYRAGGSRLTGTDSLRLPPPESPGILPFAQIPAGIVGARGVEYWVEVETSSGLFTDPPETPSANPLVIRVRSTITEDELHPGMHYRMVSIPLDFENHDLMLSDVLALGLGTYDPVRWRLFTYSPPEGLNREWSEATRSTGTFAIVPGRAYWLITRGPMRVDTRPSLAGRSVSSAEPFRITLEPGWNQIGNPFAFPVRWNAADSLVAQPLYRDAATESYISLMNGVLRPFEGVFVENLSDHRIDIAIPPVEADTTLIGAAIAGGDDWLLEIEARVEDGSSDRVQIGVQGGAHDHYDPLDCRKPPAPPQNFVDLRIDNPHFPLHRGSYQCDLRSPRPGGHGWQLHVGGGRPGHLVRIAARIRGRVPDDVRFALLDDDNQDFKELQIVDELRQVHAVIAPETGVHRQLTIIAGEPADIERMARTRAIPARLTLSPNSPNPFNPATIIRFALPQAERVQVQIFDVHGRLVNTLVDNELLPAGYYSRSWSGEDAQHQSLPSGIYFCRVHSSSGTLARKLVLVR